MNCRDVEADLVDLARSGDALAGSEALVQHLSACPACATRYRAECGLAEDLRLLAASSVVPDCPETEARLLRAFEARPNKARASAPRAWTRWALAAAASMAVLAGGWRLAVGTNTDGSGGRQQRRETPAQAAGPVQPRTPATPIGAPPPAASMLAAGPREEKGPSPRPVAVRRAAPATVAPKRAGQPADAPADDADPFVMLPAADSLPRFESGLIVRVELPVSSLPAYGFPIMPDSVRAPVTADVLVGQDGQPRAIRLVNINKQSRRQP
jgi:hypothetical protein